MSKKLDKPILEFSPYAWAKLVWFRDKRDTEIGGFGITSDKNPLLVEDFVTVKQKAGIASIDFDDNDTGRFFEEQALAGRHPTRYCRIWLHTHPSGLSVPSGTDEITFKDCFGGCNWAIMFILPKGEDAIPGAWLQYNLEPSARIKLEVKLNYSIPFKGSDYTAWEKEYKENIKHNIGVTEDDTTLYCNRSLEYSNGWFDEQTWEEEEDFWEDDSEWEEWYRDQGDKAYEEYKRGKHRKV